MGIVTSQSHVLGLGVEVELKKIRSLSHHEQISHTQKRRVIRKEIRNKSRPWPGEIRFSIFRSSTVEEVGPFIGPDGPTSESQPINTFDISLSAGENQNVVL